MNLSAGTVKELSYQQADTEQVQSLLVFQLDKRAFGLSIEYVVQIIPMLKLTPVPQVEQVIEGVANIRGKVVPILSARSYLGLPILPPQLYTPIVLVRVGERMMGLIVDEVADVLRVPASLVAPPETIMAGGSEGSALLSGVVYQGDQAIVVLDPRYLIHSNKVRAASKAIQSIPVKVLPVVQPGHPCPEGEGESVDQPAGSAETTPEAASGNGQERQNGQSKPSRKRRKLEATLAGEIANLAVDLPPSDGQSVASDDSAPIPPETPVPPETPLPSDE